MISSRGTLLQEYPTTDRGEISVPAVETELPEAEQHGRYGIWDITDQRGVTTTITGTFLGIGTSHRPDHKGHLPGTSAPKGNHCSTCRWTEIRIFQGRSGVFYLVNCGASDVPGERDWIKVLPVATPFELVEALATLNRNARSPLPVLTAPARQALAQAATHSPALEAVYISSPLT